MDMAIPEHVQQNLASIQADLMRGWQMTQAAQPQGPRGFDAFLGAAVGRARDLRSQFQSAPNGFLPLDDASAPSSGLQAFMAGLAQGAGGRPEVITPGPALRSAETVPLLPGFQAYHRAAVPGQTPIADTAYFDANAMTPDQIDTFLRAKGSPFAEQRFAGGRTAGQLIWETCQRTGDPALGGAHQLNPAILVAIMGAETSFGTDGHWAKANPFSIRLNGSFDTVQDFPSSLRIAANTMYNWAQDRPANSHETLFDYAGRHYCEDYGVTWKPNVEKFFRQALGRGGSEA